MVEERDRQTNKPTKKYRPLRVNDRSHHIQNTVEHPSDVRAFAGLNICVVTGAYGHHQEHGSCCQMNTLTLFTHLPPKIRMSKPKRELDFAVKLS